MSYITSIIPFLFNQASSEILMSRRRADYAFAFVPDWDGRGAVALSESVLKLATSILHSHAFGREPNDIDPGKDGSLAFTWGDSSSDYIYCEVGPEDYVHLYYDVSSLGKWEASSRFSEPGFLDHLSVALKHMRIAVQSMFIPVSSTYMPTKF